MINDDFLGESVNYWIEIRKRLELSQDFTDKQLIYEILDLRQKVDFYESRIKQMLQVMKYEKTNN